MKGIILEFDKAGRIVIPNVYRKFLVNGEDRHVQIALTDEGVLLSKLPLSCQLCGSTQALFHVGSRTLCSRCIGEIKDF